MKIKLEFFNKITEQLCTANIEVSSDSKLHGPFEIVSFVTEGDNKLINVFARSDNKYNLGLLFDQLKGQNKKEKVIVQFWNLETEKKETVPGRIERARVISDRWKFAKIPWVISATRIEDLIIISNNHRA